VFLMRAISVAALALFMLSLDVGHAQTCFKARPLPRCSSIVVVEAGFGAAVGSHPDPEVSTFTIEAGYMTNRTDRWSLGATVFVKGGDPINGYGVRPRYRYWLEDNKASVDFAPGVIVRTFNSHSKAPAFSGQVALNLGWALAITGQVDHVRYTDDYGTDRLASYLGARLASGAAIVGAVGFIALVGILVAGY
jgi:hypothetical protein